MTDFMAILSVLMALPSRDGYAKAEQGQRNGPEDKLELIDLVLGYSAQ